MIAGLPTAKAMRQQMLQQQKLQPKLPLKKLQLHPQNSFSTT